MSLFRALVRTAVNVAMLPVAVVKDVVTMHGVSTHDGKSPLVKALEQLKEEAE